MSSTVKTRGNLARVQQQHATFPKPNSPNNKPNNPIEGKAEVSDKNHNHLFMPTEPNTSTCTPTPTARSCLSIEILHQELKQHAESIIATFKEEMDKTRKELLLKVLSIQTTLTENIDSINSTITDLSQRTAEIEQKVNTALSGEISELRNRCDMIERKEFLTDAIVFGIPQLTDENLHNLYKKLCDTIEVIPPALKNVFRTKHRNNNDDPPVILQFTSVGERNKMLKALACYRKKTKRPISLRDIGLDSNNHVFVNESLTPRNRTLLQHAVRMKKKGQLFSVHTYLGSVIVRSTVGGKSVAVADFDCLNAVAERCQISDEEQQETAAKRKQH